MIETVVLAIFVLAMLTLAAGMWNLRAIAAAGYAPRPQRRASNRTPRPELRQSSLQTATTHFSA